MVDEVPVAVETIDEKQAYPLERPFQTMTAQTNEGRWKIRCLGEVRIYRENGQLIDWNTKAGATRKLKTLFAFLLIRGEKGANTEELADLLWSEADSIEQSLNRLYHAIRFCGSCSTAMMMPQNNLLLSCIKAQCIIYDCRTTVG